MDSTDHMSVAPCSLFLWELTTVVTMINPAAKHPQHHISLTSKFVLGTQGTSFPRVPGHRAPVQQSSSSPISLIQKSAGVNPIVPHIPHTKPHQHDIGIGTLPIFPIAPLMPREDGPAPWAGTAAEGWAETTGSTMEADKASCLQQNQGTAPSPLLTQEVTRTLQRIAKLHPTSVWIKMCSLLAAMRAHRPSAQRLQHLQTGHNIITRPISLEAPESSREFLVKKFTFPLHNKHSRRKKQHLELSPL